MSEYQLGPLPWSDEVLEKAHRNSFTEAFENIKAHPGYDLHERNSALKSVLRLFCRTADSFFLTLERFHAEVHERRLFDRNRRDDLRAFEEKFQEILYLFASAAMTLVDQSRAMSTKIELPGYAERVSSTFANNPRHRFIQELRNDLIHVTLHQPGWHLTTERDRTRTTKFMLYPHQLRRSDEWHQLAREYLLQHPKGVDLGTLIQEYRLEVAEFQEWLRNAVSAVAGEAIDDYLRCYRFLKAVGSRFWWRLLLSQIVIEAGRDPYRYLDRYLTQAEIDEIRDLPHKSKEQVDRIVEFVDEYGACDEELRCLVYKAFGVDTP
jgi:hypothetical protein